MRGIALISFMPADGVDRVFEQSDDGSPPYVDGFFQSPAIAAAAAYLATSTLSVAPLDDAPESRAALAAERHQARTRARAQQRQRGVPKTPDTETKGITT